MASPLSKTDRLVIEGIVDRLHVGTSNLGVLRVLRRKMAPGKWTKARRKAAYRVALAQHERGREFYRYVMRGGF